jgi:hypothetical protein
LRFGYKLALRSWFVDAARADYFDHGTTRARIGILSTQGTHDRRIFVGNPCFTNGSQPLRAIRAEFCPAVSAGIDAQIIHDQLLILFISDNPLRTTAHTMLPTKKATPVASRGYQIDEAPSSEPRDQLVHVWLANIPENPPTRTISVPFPSPLLPLGTKQCKGSKAGNHTPNYGFS